MDCEAHECAAILFTEWKIKEDTMKNKKILAKKIDVETLEMIVKYELK